MLTGEHSLKTYIYSKEIVPVYPYLAFENFKYVLKVWFGVG